MEQENKELNAMNIEKESTTIKHGWKVDDGEMICGGLSFDGKTDRLRILESLHNGGFLLHCPGSQQVMARFEKPKYFPAQILYAKVEGESLKFKFSISGYKSIKQGMEYAKSEINKSIGD